MQKRLLDPTRVRRVPPQFSWVDQRLVREQRLVGALTEAWALYLFLVTVADAQGLSYYADASICRHLSLPPDQLAQVRQALIDAELIAYVPPLYQVLALDAGPRYRHGPRPGPPHRQPGGRSRRCARCYGAP